MTISRTSALITKRLRKLNSSAVRYPSNQRYFASQLRSPTSEDIDRFKEILSSDEKIIVDNNNIIDFYNQDWTKQYKGSSKVVLKPSTTQEISSIISYCHSQCIPVVPQGGNTGLVGGSVPIGNEVIVSLQNLSKIHSFDADTGVLVCDAGCIVQIMQEYVKSFNYLLPVDLGSKGSCMMGGIISTNAGGQYYYRHKSLHSNVLGLEVVIGNNGKILDFCQENYKNNTGYPLHHLFIGGEGTCGIITKVCMACPPLASSTNAMFLYCGDFHQVLNIIKYVKLYLNEIVSALELMDFNILSILQEKKGSGDQLLQNCQSGIKYVLLLETQGSNSDHDKQKLEFFLENVTNQEYINDAIIANNETQIQQMWNIRESCNPSLIPIGYTYKYDISIPIHEFQLISSHVQDVLSKQYNIPDTIVTTWGHVLDGNLHLNITTPTHFQRHDTIATLLDKIVYSRVSEKRGSISAEHGIGQLKRDYLARVKDDNVLNAMYDVKRVFDPHGILNPGKVLS